VRIVSLSPAITTTLALLGQSDAIVGRSPWCRGIDPSTPVVWDGASVDGERLMALRPTHCFHQATLSSQPGDELAALGARRDWVTVAWRLDRLADVRAMIEGIGREVSGEVQAHASRMLERLDAACEPDEGVRALGPTVILFGVEPPTAFGPGSYVDDLWSAIGGRNAVTHAPYPEMTVEELMRLDPSWIVLVGGDPSIEALRRLPVRAVREGRVIHARHPGLLEPGAGVIDAVLDLKRRVREAQDSRDPKAPATPEQRDPKAPATPEQRDRKAPATPEQRDRKAPATPAPHEPQAPPVPGEGS